MIFDDSAPTTIPSLKRDLMNKLEMEMSSIDNLIARKRKLHPLLPDEAFCPLVWREASDAATATV